MARMTKAQLESQVTALSTTLQVREREIAELKAELHQLRTSNSSVSSAQKQVNPTSKLDPKYIEYSKARAQAFKLKAWFDKARSVKEMSDSLYDFAQQLKVAIVKEADGKNGDLQNIKNKETQRGTALQLPFVF